MKRLPSHETVKRAREAAKRNYGYLLISLGAHGRFPELSKSLEAYNEVVVNADLRANLIKTMGRLIEEFDIDGIDLNYEYPETDEQWQGLKDLVHEAREALGKKLITVSSRADAKDVDKLAKFKIPEDVDFILGFGFGPKMDPYQHTGTAHANSFIGWVMRSKLQEKKFVLGIPFFARNRKNPDEYLPYKDYYQMLDNDTQKTANESLVVCNRAFVGHQGILAKHTQIGGIFLFALGHDIQPITTNNSLFSALFDGSTYGNANSHAHGAHEDDEF